MRRYRPLIWVLLLGIGPFVLIGVLVDQWRATPPDEAAIRQLVVGSWRSPDMTHDVPTFIVDTYRADGTRETDYYADVLGNVKRDPTLTDHGRWRLSGGSLEVGVVDAQGNFKPTDRPRPLVWDRDGKLHAIADYQWFVIPTTQAGSTSALEKHQRE